MPDYIIRRDQGQAEAKASRLRPKFWPQGHFGLEDLTSLVLPETPHCGRQDPAIAPYRTARRRR